MQGYNYEFLNKNMLQTLMRFMQRDYNSPNKLFRPLIKSASPKSRIASS